MKRKLIHDICVTSSGTIAHMTGCDRYADISAITNKAIEIVENMPEKAVEALSHDGEHFSLRVLHKLFNDAKKAI